MASETAQLTAKVRGELGSRKNKRLRDAGFIAKFSAKEVAFITASMPPAEASVAASPQ